jgi:serine/threonine protein kinase
MLRPHEVIEGRYEILGLEPLGQGGMGRVWQAKDKKVGSIVAVKEFEPTSELKISANDRENLIQLFWKEAELLAGLEHEAFPKVRDKCKTAEGKPCIIMDFVSGSDFGDRLVQQQNVPFKVDDVLNWLSQLLQALEYLHTRPNPVIHKDIKPPNLKLTQNGRIKLLDFGIAKGQIGEMTLLQGSVPFGTIQYAPLEQVLKASDVVKKGLSEINRDMVERFLAQKTSPQTDIFSLCATIYRLLCGTLPEYFDVQSRALKVWNNKPDPLTDLVELNSTVPKKLSDLIKRGMSLNVEDRIQSAEEMSKVLHEIKEDAEHANHQKAQNVLKDKLQFEFNQKLDGITFQYEKQAEATTQNLNERRLKAEEYRSRVEELEISLKQANEETVGLERLNELEETAKVYQEKLLKLEGDLLRVTEESRNNAISAFKNGLLNRFGIKVAPISKEFGTSEFFGKELETAFRSIESRQMAVHNFAVSNKNVLSAGNQKPGRISAISSLLTIAIPLPLIIAAYFSWSSVTYNKGASETLFLFIVTLILSLAVPLFSLVILSAAEKLFGVIGKGRNNRVRKYMMIFCILIFVCGMMGAFSGMLADGIWSRDVMGIIRGNIIGMAAGHFIFAVFFYFELIKKGD